MNKNTSTRNITILFFMMVVVMLGFGILIPILPFYIKKFGASGSAMGMVMAIYSLMQFICAPLWGQLSDRIGRKPVILIGVTGNAISLLIIAFANSLWMLFFARFIAGVLSSATLPTAMAFIGDSTSEEDRGGGMGILGAAMGLGMVLGPGIAGPLAEINLSYPFFVASCLSVLALGLIYFFLPESLPSDQRTSIKTKTRGIKLSELWQALFGPIGFLLLLSFLVNFGMTNFEGIFGLYAAKEYNYGPKEVGYLMTFLGILTAIIQGFLTGYLSRRIGESVLIKITLLLSAISFLTLLLPNPNSQWSIWGWVGFFILCNSLLRPASSSLISKKADGGQGTAMGMNNAFMSLGRVIGPLWAGMAFDANLKLPYISGAVILFIGFGLSLIQLDK